MESEPEVHHHDQSFDCRSITHHSRQISKGNIKISKDFSHSDNLFNFIDDKHIASVDSPMALMAVNLPAFGHGRRDSMSSSTFLSPVSEHDWDSMEFSPIDNVEFPGRLQFGYGFHDQSAISDVAASQFYSQSGQLYTNMNNWLPDHALNGHVTGSSDLIHQLDFSKDIQIETPQTFPFEAAGPRMAFSPVSSTDTSSSSFGQDTQSTKKSLYGGSGSTAAAVAQFQALSDNGARKKNARIDIPADRNLANIEELLEQAQDDIEIRELKAHRRLLRNREAALASRQRKKQHTEDLEVKELDYVKQISDLRSSLHEYMTRSQQLEVDNEFLQQKYVETCHALQSSELEKEELIINHSQETGTLRHRLQILSDQIQDMSIASSKKEENLVEQVSHVDALGINSGLWNHSSQDSSQSTLTIAPTKIIPSTTTSNDRLIDQPIASGVLFMILLCGALVASRPESSQWLPSLPDEVRLASNTVLDDLLGNSKQLHTANFDINPTLMVNGMNSMSNSAEACTLWDFPNGALATSTSIGLSDDADGANDMTHANEISPMQYNSLTNLDGYAVTNPGTTSNNKRNLVETLTALRAQSISSAGPGEAYSKSLLWDRIPAEVIEQFKGLVKDRQASAIVNNDDMLDDFCNGNAHPAATNWAWSSTSL